MPGLLTLGLRMSTTPIPRPRYRGAIGVLRQAGQYLLVQRAAGLAKGGFWCFPGGHVEPRENSRAALIRELREELGITIMPAARLGAVRVADSKYVLATWLVEHDGTPLKPDPEEIADTKWLSLEQIRDHPLGLPSNEAVVRLIEQWMA